jgi:DNA topoisomerase III
MVWRACFLIFSGTVVSVARLIICEKPSVAADVAKALGSNSERFERTEWGYRSPDNWIAAAAGHLVAELPPEKYDERYKQWSYADLPILPERFMYQPRDTRAASRLKTLAALIRDPQATELVNASDAAREGELIFKLIVQYARLDRPKPILRAWFSSMTPDAINAAFANLRPDNEMLPLEYAARCRSEADWYVGMNATRAATCTLGGQRQLLSMGRVQTPTLALVARRDFEIERFEVEEYFTLEAAFVAAAGPYSGQWRASRSPEAQDRFATRAEAEAVAAAVRATPHGCVADVETRTERVKAPKLFDLTALQREANARYAMTAAKTLEAAQACYETHKVLSYPRTDSAYLTSDMAPVVPQLLARVATLGGEFATAVTSINSAGYDTGVVINDAKVSDHHALVPVNGPLDLTPLSKDERQVFELVAWRLLAALGAAQVLERTVAWTEVSAPGGAVWFRSAGRREIERGWKAYWPEAPTKQAKDSAQDDDSETAADDQLLPALTDDESVRVEDASASGRHTRPPAHFTESSLLGVMASAGRLIADDELAEAMKDSGLGTPATRAATIERLVSVGYIERSGRKMFATAKGRGLIMALGDHPLTNPELTGAWEKRLRELERSRPDDAAALRASFVADARQFTSEIVAGMEGLDPEMLLAGRKLLVPCPTPSCGGSVVAGQRGWGCTSWKSKEDRGCGFIIWREQSGGKLTEKQMLTQVAEMSAGTRALPEPPAERVELGPCPSPDCVGTVLERPKSWGCDSWKGPKDTGCGYVIWKSSGDGTTVEVETAAAMLAAGTSNGRPAPETLAPCPMPRCKGSIVERVRNFSCNSWKSPTKKGCGLTLWKTAKDGTVLVTTETLAEALERAVVDRAAAKAKKSR